jgi:chromosome segregation ATPase
MTHQTTAELAGLLDQVNQIMDRQMQHRIKQHNRVVSRVGSLVQLSAAASAKAPTSPLALKSPAPAPALRAPDDRRGKMLTSLYQVLNATARLGELDDDLDEVVNTVIQRSEDTRATMVALDQRLQTLAAVSRQQKVALARAAEVAQSLEIARVNAVTHADTLRNRLISRTEEVRALERQLKHMREQLIVAQNAQIAVFENGWSDEGA